MPKEKLEEGKPFTRSCWKIVCVAKFSTLFFNNFLHKCVGHSYWSIIWFLTGSGFKTVELPRQLGALAIKFAPPSLFQPWPPLERWGLTLSGTYCSLNTGIQNQGRSEQCCGSGMFILDPTFFHNGSRIRIFSIPDPGSTAKNLGILTQKMVAKL